MGLRIMTTATQVVNATYAELYKPQTVQQRVNNPVPTPEQIRVALRHFEQPAELHNTRIESWLINMRMIERFITPHQKTAARKDGSYARKYYVQTARGYLFLRPASECMALVPVNECRALLAPRDIRREVVTRFWVTECFKPHARAVEDLAPLFERAPRVSDCPFLGGD